MIGAATAGTQRRGFRHAREFRQIDKPKAEAAAKQELGIADRTLHTLLYQANIFSVGPAFMFDVAPSSSRKSSNALWSWRRHPHDARQHC